LESDKVPVAILMLLAASFTVSQVASQSYTTITSTTTVVNSETSTISSTFPVSSISITTNTEKILHYAWTLGGDSAHCVNQWFSFEALAGDTVEGTLAASLGADVFLLSNGEFAAWSNQNLCDPFYGSGSVNPNAIRVQYHWLVNNQMQIHWVATISDTFWLLVETITAGKDSVTVNLLEQTNQVNTETSYSTQYSTMVTLSTQTSFQTLSEQQPPSTTSIQDNTFSYSLATVCVLILLIASVALIRHRKRGKHTRVY